jgi:hypothetical protein
MTVVYKFNCRYPDYDTTIFVGVNRNDIPEDPGKEPPVNGAAAAFDMFAKAWDAVKPQ